MEAKAKIRCQESEKKYNANLVYFVSSRRIPEASFESAKNEILTEEGVAVIRYDNQGMATTYLTKGKIAELLNFLRIDLHEIADSAHSGLNKHKSACGEAVSAFMVFGDETRDLRKHAFGALIKAEIVKSTEALDRNNLISKVIKKNGLSDSQYKVVNSHIDRLIQAKEIIPNGQVLNLEEKELEKFKSVSQIVDLEAAGILEAVSIYIKQEHVKLNGESLNFLIDNLLQLSVCLITNQFSENHQSSQEYELYKKVHDFLISKIGIDNANALLYGLTKIVANSDFSKHVVTAKMYAAVLNSTSDQLVMALGGRTGVSVLFDSSVVIPMLCGLVFRPVDDRSGYSAKLLFNLLAEHQFSGVVPKVYVEEVAAHIIEACRDYAAILETGDNICHSDNAFVSHFSICRESGEMDFGEYADIFGVRLNQIRPGMSDAAFYSLRDRSIIQISGLLGRYGLSVLDTKGWSRNAYDRVDNALKNSNISRPEVLIKHDASVITCLSGNELPSDEAKILCTWDGVHHDINPDGSWGYLVMNPVATIDLFAIAKSGHTDYPLSTLLDFMRLQTEDTKVISDRIWDAIAGYEKGALSDAKLLSTARRFKEKYILDRSDQDGVDLEDVSRAWIKWKNSHQTNRGSI